MGGAALTRRTVCLLTHVCNVKTESRGSEEEKLGRGRNVGDMKEEWGWVGTTGTLEDTVRSRCLDLNIGSHRRAGKHPQKTESPVKVGAAQGETISSFDWSYLRRQR